VLRGWAVAAEGDITEGVALLRKGIDDWKATGAVTYYTYFLGILAETLLQMGAVGEARSLLDEAIAQTDATDERLFAAELHRLRGIAIGRDASDPSSKFESASAELLQAYDIAVQQEAKSALRAATSLAQLNVTRKTNADESRNRLNLIYGQFSEGCQTPDVQEAQALIIA
jgi:predicted ATPase